MVVPPHIQPGDLIGIVSPSGSFERERLAVRASRTSGTGASGVRVGSAVYDRDPVTSRDRTRTVRTT